MLDALFLNQRQSERMMWCTKFIYWHTQSIKVKLWLLTFFNLKFLIRICWCILVDLLFDKSSTIHYVGSLLLLRGLALLNFWLIMTIGRIKLIRIECLQPSKPRYGLSICLLILDLQLYRIQFDFTAREQVIDFLVSGRLHNLLFNFLHRCLLLGLFHWGLDGRTSCASFIWWNHAESGDLFLVGNYIVNFLFFLFRLCQLLKRLGCVINKSRIDASSDCKRDLTLLAYWAQSLLSWVAVVIVHLLVRDISPGRYFSWRWRALWLFRCKSTHIHGIGLLIPRFPALLGRIVIVGHRLTRAQIIVHYF